MQSQGNHFSYFLTGERDLESLEKDYFSARPVDEQSDQEDNYGSDFSSNETDQEIDSEVDFDFLECNISDRSKVQAFVSKTCGCTHGYKVSPCSSSIQIEDIVDCRNNWAELFSTELDLVILGTIHSTINCAQASYKLQAEKGGEDHSATEYDISTRRPNNAHGRNKIQGAWDSTPYRVVAVPANSLGSVYTLEPVNNPG